MPDDDGSQKVGWFGRLGFTIKDLILIVGATVTIVAGYYKGQADADARAKQIAMEIVSVRSDLVQVRVAEIERRVGVLETWRESRSVWRDSRTSRATP